MITGIITFLVIFAVIGSILYGQRLVKTEKSDAVFGNPERAKGGVHWVIVGSSFLLLSWLYYSWDIAKSFYPKSANELCQVAKVNESLLSLKYLFPIEEKSHKSTALIKRENINIKNKVLTPQTYEAVGTAKYRVGILTGCVQDHLNPRINHSTIRLLNRHGCDVVLLSGVNCCGAINWHLEHRIIVNENRTIVFN